MPAHFTLNWLRGSAEAPLGSPQSRIKKIFIGAQPLSLSILTTASAPLSVHPHDGHILSPSVFMSRLLFLLVVLCPKPKTSITTENHKGKETMINSHVPGSSPNSQGECLLKSALSFKTHISILTGREGGKCLLYRHMVQTKTET